MYMDTALPTVQDYQFLIEGLASGADQPVYSATEWRPFVGSSPLAREFLAQMESEWLPFNVPNDICQGIMEQVMAHLAPNAGWQHLWGHIRRVTGYALALAPEANVDPVHAFLLGILHDVGKLDELRTGVAHELIGGLLARKILATYPEAFPGALVDRIATTIAKQNQSTDSFVQLLYDADKLDKIGATGITRRLTTAYGTRHARQALRQVENELATFPKMHLPTSIQLAASKETFTETFLKRVRGMLSWL